MDSNIRARHRLGAAAALTVLASLVVSGGVPAQAKGVAAKKDVTIAIEPGNTAHRR